MARPVKNGLDYFPLDCNLDTKMELIEAMYGITGFAVIIKLYQKIYAENGYYCNWTEEVGLIFFSRCGIDFTTGNKIVNSAIDRGIFDKQIFQKYQVLTSSGIQKRYFEATARRKQVQVEGEYLLLSAGSIPVNVDVNRVNVNINSENDNHNTQSKVKESKEKKSKEDIRHKYGEYKNVLLSDTELEKLKKDFPADWNQRMERLSEYMASTGTVYKGHLATIRTWARRDKKTMEKTDKPNASYNLEEYENRSIFDD